MIQAMKRDRDYRQHLAERALIFVAGAELEVTVRNISVTGLYAELDESILLKNPKDIVKAIKNEPVIDILFEKLDLIGDATVTRIDRDDGKISMAMAFKNIAYGVSTRLYERSVYRKNLTGPGFILINGKKYEFKAHNVSLHGLMVSIAKRVPIKKNMLTRFVFKKLKLQGKVKVVWYEYDAQNNTVLGLQYVNMEKSALSGKIPSFQRSRRK